MRVFELSTKGIGAGRRILSWHFVLGVLLLSTFVQANIFGAYNDHQPRAALLSLAHERDIHGILQSIHQLEDSFNSKYLYHWVFFSTEPLSDSFRRLTSNATNATCIYEVVVNDKRHVSGNVEVAPKDSSFVIPRENAFGQHGPDVQPRKRTYRWRWDQVSKSPRLRDYDWLWRIEPGVSVAVLLRREAVSADI